MAIQFREFLINSEDLETISDALVWYTDGMTNAEDRLRIATIILNLSYQVNALAMRPLRLNMQESARLIISRK